MPLVDAIAERFGLHVTLLMVGPIGSEGGDVSVRRYDFSSYSCFRVLLTDVPSYIASTLIQATAQSIRYGLRSITLGLRMRSRRFVALGVHFSVRTPPFYLTVVRGSNYPFSQAAMPRPRLLSR